MSDDHDLTIGQVIVGVVLYLVLCFALLALGTSMRPDV